MFDLLGTNPYFSDCTFLRSMYSLGETATVSDGGKSAGMIFQHNTIKLLNSFVGITPGLVATIAYADHSPIPAVCWVCFCFSPPRDCTGGGHYLLSGRNDAPTPMLC